MTEDVVQLLSPDGERHDHPDYPLDCDHERLRALYGLDQPWLDRYLAWAGQALQGEFGYSRLFADTVFAALAEPLGRTIVLMGASFAIGIAIGIPAGIAAGARPHSRLDYTVNLICFAGVAMPAFWLALLMILLFSVTLRWLPATLLVAARNPVGGCPRPCWRLPAPLLVAARNPDGGCPQPC